MFKLVVVLAALAGLSLAAPAALAQVKPNIPDKPNVEEPAPPEPDKPEPPPQEPAVESVTSRNPDSVVAILKRLGVTAEVGKTSAGRTKISFEYKDASTSLYLFDCHDGMGDCDSIRFLHGLNFPDGVTLTAADNWNSTELWGRAFLDDNGDPWLDTMVWVGESLSLQQFAEVLDKWTTAVAKFRTHFEKS